MEAQSQTLSSNTTHFRSISLPARLHHPNKTLQKLNSWQVSGRNYSSDKQSSEITSEEILSDLCRVEELYRTAQELTVEESRLLPRTSIDELLTESVDLMDACSAIRELFQTLREIVRRLQSALRRKGLDAAAVQPDIAAYFSCRRNTNKTAARTSKSLKNFMQKTAGGRHGDHFRELAGATIRVFRSILGLLNPAAGEVNSGGWPLVSRLMATKSSPDGGLMVSEIRNLDLAVKSVVGKMRKNESRVHVYDDVDDQVRRVHVSLQGADDVIGEIDAGLDRLMRQLVQTRVHLLNILTHNL
ncbi:uncharacterized protein LOC127257037 [Andrographis paniculata]|uniref:uncharacterized protein LOC127257037 n=1 Tax=Andrographis paniculata TaxID=175694 RepID=UPI0021E804BE|nr:uncharacterized protein LOC127257037 [Andrographis paniculata]